MGRTMKLDRDHGSDLEDIIDQPQSLDSQSEVCEDAHVPAEICHECFGSSVKYLTIPFYLIAGTQNSFARPS